VGLGFLSLYLAGKLKLFDEEGHVSKSIVVLFPVLLAILVGVTRVDDNKHHWQDVLVGLAIGGCYEKQDVVIYGSRKI
jgi:diacylglycerol diphosphate phosphatase/phosphatidate phosphatase